MKTYHGQRVRGVAIVRVVQDDGNDYILSPEPSQRIRNHSPCGFEWGYCGSGPAQLALAILLDLFGDPDLAQDCYQWFKQAVVAGWGDEWFITSGQVSEWAWQWEQERPKDQ